MLILSLFVIPFVFLKIFTAVITDYNFYPRINEQYIPTYYLVIIFIAIGAYQRHLLRVVPTHSALFEVFFSIFTIQKKLRGFSFSNCPKFIKICPFLSILYVCPPFLKYYELYVDSLEKQRQVYCSYLGHMQNILGQLFFMVNLKLWLIRLSLNQ